MEKRPYPGSKFSTFIPFSAKNLASLILPKYNSHPWHEHITLAEKILFNSFCWDEMSGLDVLDEERDPQLQEHRGGQNICTLVCIHWLETPRNHEVKWMHNAEAEAEQFNVFHISLLSLTPRWTLSPPPSHQEAALVTASTWPMCSPDPAPGQWWWQCPTHWLN